MSSQDLIIGWYQTYRHSHTCPQTYSFMYAPKRNAHMHKRAHKHTCVCRHTYAPLYTHTHTHTHIQTHANLPASAAGVPGAPVQGQEQGCCPLAVPQRHRASAAGAAPHLCIPAHHHRPPQQVGGLLWPHCIPQVSPWMRAWAFGADRCKGAPQTSRCLAFAGSCRVPADSRTERGIPLNRLGGVALADSPKGFLASVDHAARTCSPCPRNKGVQPPARGVPVWGMSLRNRDRAWSCSALHVPMIEQGALSTSYIHN